MCALHVTTRTHILASAAMRNVAVATGSQRCLSTSVEAGVTRPTHDHTVFETAFSPKSLVGVDSVVSVAQSHAYSVCRWRATVDGKW
jgi:hypothetical protein